MTGDKEEQGPISHGMCRACFEALQYEPVSLNEFLQKLKAPVMMVDKEGRVLGANSGVEVILGKESDEIANRLSGEVLECVNASLPGGCGRTVHCTGCTIRGAVDRTRETGVSETGIPAFIMTKTPDGVQRTWFRISTELLGNVVLLRIDAFGQGEEPPLFASLYPG